ncbi:MAG TPA: LuxR C-terminal-related transcriptional regulator [Ilumatobacteraceae bacterium]
MTLISAPAGFGKTALIADWLTDQPRAQWAWLSLDVRDNDLVRFWSYVIEALRSVTEGVGEASLQGLIRSGGQGPVEQWLGPLLNELVAVDQLTSYLVVDDLHVVTDPEIRASFTLFAASMPSWLRLIIVTRADPPLPWPRLRAEGRLAEIRQRDLLFDIREAETLLRAEAVDSLTDDQLQWLTDRTEGWAAGLQLAAIVLGDSSGPDRLLQIAGSNRTFSDYIVSEVVDVVSDDMRRFLFTTSVLDRVSPSLAKAVSGLDDAGQLLRDAQQRGLFIVALDEHGEWYRYNALFAEAIQAEAQSRSPELVQLANEAAAKWFEGRDDFVVALDHWFAADRPDEALRIAASGFVQLLDTGQMKGIERIVSLIPASLVGNDAHRQLDYALLHLVIDAETMRWWADQAATTIASLAAPDDELVRRHQAVRANCDLLAGEWENAAVHAAAAIDPRGVGEGDSEVVRRTGLQLLRAKGWMDEPDPAEQIFRTYLHHQSSVPAVRRFVAPCAWALAAATCGRILEADRWSSKAAATDHQFGNSLTAYQDLLLARAVISRERFDNAAARCSIEKLRVLPSMSTDSLRVLAEVEVALGFISEERPAEAAHTLDDVVLMMAEISRGPLIHDAVDRAWTELHLATGDIARARQSAQRMRVGLWRDATLAKVLLADGASEQAAEILDSLSPTSPRQRVTVGLMHAIALADHDQASSLAMAAAALTIASNEGMLQTVVGVGHGVADLVESASWVVPDDWMQAIRRRLAKGRNGVVTGRVSGLYEQPTERERAVARYLASRLTAPEIARELGISTNTLKTHVTALYRKLDVNSRSAAVDKARDVGILG